MPRVLPPKILRDLRVFLAPFEGLQPERWRAAIDAALTPKRAAKPARERREKKAELRREKFSAIRKQVEKRAGGRCEACLHELSDADPGEADHFYGGNGRRKALESVETVWLLHRTCHRQKTANEPSRLHWLCRFRDHATAHGYFNAALAATRQVEALYLKAAASSPEEPF